MNLSNIRSREPSSKGRESQLPVWGHILGLLLVLVGLYLTVVVTRSPELGAQLVPTFLLMLVAFGLGAANSRWLIVYILGVWAFAPEIRRLVDYSYGAYQSVSILSLAPMLCTAALLLPILRHPFGLSQRMKKIVILLGLALLYAGGMGIIRNGIAAVYELATMLLPMLIIPYMALRPLNVQERDQWLSAFVALGIVVSAYGWFQYLLAPPWDMFWLVKSGMTSSMGTPVPLGFRVFSTLNSTGPAAQFMGFALALAIINQRWRGPLGWLGVFLMASAVAVTEVRAVWISIIVILVSYAVVSSNKARWQTLIGVAVLGTGLSLMLPHIPGGDTVIKRSQTFGALGKDNSANARAGLTQSLLPIVMTNPFGKGMGSTGVGDKLNHDDGGGGNGSFDNGFLALLLTFGVFGFLAFLSAFWQLGLAAFASGRVRNLQEYSRLGQAALLTTIVLLTFNQVLDGLGGFMLWFLLCPAFCANRLKPIPTAI